MAQNLNSRLNALDAFRGLAAIAVVLFHYTMLTPQADLGFKYGVTGVDIFFLFSGFVVLISLKETATFRQILVNRIARLYPAYWSAVLFTGTLIWYYNVHTPSELKEFMLTLFANLSMFQYFLQRPNIDGPYWTMTYEVLFYAFMLCVFAFKGIRKIEWIAFGGIVFTAMQNFVFKNYLPGFFVFLQTWVPILSHFSLFMAGIIFYKIRTEGTTITRVLTIVFAWLIQLASFENGGMSHVYIEFNAYFVLVTLYFIIMFLMIYDKLNFLAAKPLLFFGSISYPLFLIHQFISRSVIIPVLVKYEHYSFWLACAVAFAVCFVLATLISKLVEKPFGDQIRKLK